MNPQLARRLLGMLRVHVGGDPHILLIRRSTHTDIITNVNDPDQAHRVAEWLRSIADQIDNQGKIILP